MRVRTLFLTADAVDHRGAYVHSDPQALIKRELLKIADETVLLVRHQCFAGSAPLLVGTLAQMSTIVTDRPPPSPMWAALDHARVRVQIAGGEPSTSSADMRIRSLLATNGASLGDPVQAGRN
jgi:DeoR/GlpR family transcriptional regulator of sugar metabolism